jgi:hypothetical protein
MGGGGSYYISFLIYLVSIFKNVSADERFKDLNMQHMSRVKYVSRSET